MNERTKIILFILLLAVCFVLALPGISLASPAQEQQIVTVSEQRLDDTAREQQKAGRTETTRAEAKASGRKAFHNSLTVCF